MTPVDVIKPVEELCLISMPKIILTIEAGVGTKTLPMLIFEAGFKGSARNWSSQVINISLLFLNKQKILLNLKLLMEIINDTLISQISAESHKKTFVECA